ncbi:unnamed protein product [Closterium sp. NIES-64]|nr:unnamed protein product [Closterium sp. NIES-64]
MEQSPEDPYAPRGIAKLSKSKSYDRWLLDPQKPFKGLQQPPPNRMGQWAAIAVASLLFSLILLNPTVVDDALSIMMRTINPTHVDVFTRGLATLQWWEDQYPPPLSPPENVELKEQQPGHVLWKTFRITRVAAFNVDRRIIKQTKQAGFQLVPLAAPPLLKDLTWDDIFADRFDDDPTPQCPKLPLPEWSQDLRTVDALIAHMPCQPVNGSFARDVRWHQLVLTVAEYVKQSARPWMPVVVLSDCRPPPNLFHCNRLVHRDGPVWLFNLTVADMRRRLQPVGNCALATPEPQRLPGQLPDQQPAAARRVAYATVLHSKEDYVCGAIALANSLRRSGTHADLVALVSAEIGNFSRGGLEAAGWRLIEIERIRNPFGRAGTYNQWNYSKLRLWQLTEYAKVVFVDADILVLRNMDHLFEYPELSARSNSRRFFNSGVMVIEPSQCTFELMMENIELIQSYNGGDQGFVNDVFYWWHRLPKSINTLKYINADDGPKRDTETEALDSLIASDPPTIHALHFLGKKPWRCYRDFDCNIVMNTHRRFVHHALAPPANSHRLSSSFFGLLHSTLITTTMAATTMAAAKIASGAIAAVSNPAQGTTLTSSFAGVRQQSATAAFGVKSTARTVAFFKLGGESAKSAGIFASQLRDDYDVDDIAHYFNYSGMLAAEGSYEKMAKMVESGTHACDILLMMAASEGDVRKIEELLYAGARCDVPDWEGRTALDRACSAEIREMIQQGALTGAI